MKKITENNGQTRHLWWNEANTLKEISKSDHAHLIRPIAAVSWNNEHVLLFKWADKGNLRDYFKEHPTPLLTAQLIERVITQLYGISKGLSVMHDAFTTAQKKEESLTNLEPLTRQETIQDPRITITDAPGITITQTPDTQSIEHPQIMVEEADGHLSPIGQHRADRTRGDIKKQENWRHGDLKPENILIFGETWQIADLGLAKKHDRETALRPFATKQIFATFDYEAPEAVTNPDRATSRRYDIWSMGCIFFESFIWLLEGQQGLDAFLDADTSARRSQTTHYYEVSGINERTLDTTVSAKVSSKVRDWILKIRQEDPELNTGYPTALSDLLHLIEDKLLVVSLDGAEGRTRVTADVLCSELESILSKGREEGGDKYFFTGHPRPSLHYSSPPNNQSSHLRNGLSPPSGHPSEQVR